jgi:hypothetical protein
MATKPITPQWAGIGYGRKKRAHFWRESPSNSFFARSSCGIEILAEYLKSATGLHRCKTCEKAGGSHG